MNNTTQKLIAASALVLGMGTIAACGGAQVPDNASNQNSTGDVLVDEAVDALVEEAADAIEEETDVTSEEVVDAIEEAEEAIEEATAE